MTLYRFESVRFRKEKRGHCLWCGKPTVRRRTFEQTINPFNRNAEGQPKTYDEVKADVRAEAEAWEPDFRHNTERCAA